MFEIENIPARGFDVTADNTTTYRLIEHELMCFNSFFDIPVCDSLRTYEHSRSDLK